MVEYLERCVDTVVKRGLESSGGVLLEGPRACGKTETGFQHSRSFVRLDASPEETVLAQEHPEIILRGENPRLVDEWQLAPATWNAARHAIDSSRQKGMFIFSGSAVPRDDVTRHTGAGRFSRIRMRPMSLAESGDSSKEISLSRLRAESDSISGVSSVTYEGLAHLAVRGGWPGLIGEPERIHMDFNADYLENLFRVELPEADNRRREPERLDRLIRVVARNLGGEAKIARIAAEISADGRSADRKTVRDDLDALSRVFAYEPLTAWSVDLRSRTRLRTTERLFLADPSLAVAALGAGPDRLIRGREYFGFVFEAMALRDLRVYSALEGGHVYYYRDADGLEVDAIIDYRNTWAAVEMKLGSTEIEKAETNLLALRDKVDLGVVGEPVFLAIVTGTQYAYTLKSGVHVIPLATLTW